MASTSTRPRAVERSSLASAACSSSSFWVTRSDLGPGQLAAGGEQLGACGSDEGEGDEGPPGSPGANDDERRADEDCSEQKAQRCPEKHVHGGILPLATRGGAVR